MFRFTIRDVLWLTVVVAALMGWLADRYLWSEKLAAQQRFYDAAAERLNAKLRQHLPEQPIIVTQEPDAISGQTASPLP